MSNLSFAQKVSSAFAKIPEGFYSYFPRLRKQYQKIHELNAIFAKIEQVAFTSFPSLKHCKDNPHLFLQRAITIQEIQKTYVEGKTVQEWLHYGAEKLKGSHSKDLYAHEKEQWNFFEQQLIGLQYRSGKVEKGTNLERGALLLNTIEPIIRKYLASSIFPGRYNAKSDKQLPQLTPEERRQLEHTCLNYPLLIEKFLERSKKSEKTNDPWISSFVKWTLRSGCNVGIFVKTPQEKELLASVHLDKRSGAIDGRKGIHFKDVVIDGTSRKVVCLKIDDKMEPIQGAFKKREVTLRNLIQPTATGMTLSIEKIIRLFKEKTNGYGDVEYLAGGVRNWNAIELGSFNQTTNQHDTIEPSKLFEELLNKAPLAPLSYEMIQRRYANAQELSPNQWALAPKGSRLRTNLNLLQAHGYQDLVYRKGDLYYVFPMGIQPKKFPKNSLEKLLFFSATSVAGLHYPDESNFLSQRNHIGWLFPLSDIEAIRLQEQLIETYSNAKNGKLLFQFAGDNCAFHIQKFFDKTIAAPFYDKLQSVLNNYLSSRNIISKQLLKNNSVKAFQGLNHAILKDILSYMIDDLWGKRDLGNINDLTSRALHLLGKIYNKPFDPIPIEKIDFSKPNGKEELKELLFQTIEVARFYRMDLFRTETDQPFLAAVNKIVAIAPWRWLKKGVINVVLLLMGSWRWIISHDEKQQTILPSLSLKNLASNPLIQEGYLNHPAALWEWISLRNQRLEATQECLKKLNKRLISGQ